MIFISCFDGVTILLCSSSTKNGKDDDNDSPVKRDRKLKRQIEDSSDEDENESRDGKSVKLNMCEAATDETKSSDEKQKMPNTPPKRLTG